MYQIVPQINYTVRTSAPEADIEIRRLRYDTIIEPPNVFSLFNGLGAEIYKRSYLLDLLYSVTRKTIDTPYWLRGQALKTKTEDAVVALEGQRGKQTWRTLLNFISGKVQSGTAPQIKLYTFFTCEYPHQGETFTRTMRPFHIKKEELLRLASGQTSTGKIIHFTVDSPTDERRLITLQAIARKFVAGEYKKGIHYKVLRARRLIEDQDLNLDD